MSRLNLFWCAIAPEFSFSSLFQARVSLDFRWGFLGVCSGFLRVFSGFFLGFFLGVFLGFFVLVFLGVFSGIFCFSFLEFFWG